MHVTNCVHHPGRPQVEEHFSTYSTQAWHAVVTQLFKMYVLSRVTLKSFRALPNVGSHKVRRLLFVF